MQKLILRWTSAMQKYARDETFDWNRVNQHNPTYWINGPSLSSMSHVNWLINLLLSFVCNLLLEYAQAQTLNLHAWGNYSSWVTWKYHGNFVYPSFHPIPSIRFGDIRHCCFYDAVQIAYDKRENCVLCMRLISSHHKILHFRWVVDSYCIILNSFSFTLIPAKQLIPTK